MINHNARNTIFSNSSDIDTFFAGYPNSQDFISWFNSNMNGVDYFSNSQIIKTNANWNEIWNSLGVIFGTTTINLVQFLAINTIILNQTNSTFVSISEFSGSAGHPGISYAFDTVNPLKNSYNTLSTNRTALYLFNDPFYISIHGHEPFGNVLSNTVDARWGGSIFPQGFSGNVNRETSTNTSLNGFISEADFYKFRGRGFIQTRGRDTYKPIIQYILSYTGGDETILSYKNSWSSYNANLDQISSASKNSDWDTLYSSNDICNYSINANANSYNLPDNLIGYTNINSQLSDPSLNVAIKNVYIAIYGNNNAQATTAFLNQVRQQLTFLETQDPPGNQVNTSNPSSVSPFTPPPSQNLNVEAGTNVQNQFLPLDENLSDQKQSNVNQGKVPGLTNIFATTLTLPPIQFNAPPSVSVTKEFVAGLGFLPFVWYNNYQIDISSIDSLMLYNDGIIPQINMTFRDPLNFMKDKGFPLDDTKIRVFLNPRSTQLKAIYLQFKILTFSIVNGKYHLTGSLDVNRLYTTTIASFPSQTSFQALQNVCKYLGLGFNSNTDNSNDLQTWIDSANKTEAFIDHILDHAYKSDSAFIFGYIDFYYNFNYVNIQDELLRDIKNDAGMSTTGFEDLFNVNSQNSITSIYLSNDPALAGNSNYFESYRVLNNSTSISIDVGYVNTIKYYDDVNEDFLVFNMDSITSQGSDSILLKGAPQDNVFYKENVNLLYFGKIDSDNSHPNYYYAKHQNFKNIVDLQKVGIEITLPTPNYNLYRFQKINVAISNYTSTPSQTYVVNRLSGHWLITDIKFIYKKEGGLKQIVTLFKRELELSAQELQNEPQQTLVNNNVSTNGNDQTDNINPSNFPVTGGSASTYSPSISATSSTQPSQWIVSFGLFQHLYSGRGATNNVITTWYNYMATVMVSNGMNTPERTAAFLSQINVESFFLLWVTELGSGSNYQGNKSLGNTDPGDGIKYKGRGLLQLTGKTNYQKAGDFLNQDFVTNPTLVSTDNASHKQDLDTSTQINNSINTALWFWNSHNLNTYADLMSVNAGMDLGSFGLSQLPGSTTNISSSSFISQYGGSSKHNFATYVNSSNPNLLALTKICIFINGGYNGYGDRISSWENIASSLSSNNA